MWALPGSRPGHVEVKDRICLAQNADPRQVAEQKLAAKLQETPNDISLLLQMGSYELLLRPDVPTGAVISEAVELAKRFSTEDSGRFVNGVLSAIAGEVRPTPA